MSTRQSAADASAASCQGYLVKHGGFFFKKVQKRFFILKGSVLSWEKRSGVSDASKDKGSLAVTSDTVVDVVDAGSSFFEFEIVNFRPIKCSHAGNAPYRLGATSGEERDMWVDCLQQAARGINAGNANQGQNDGSSPLSRSTLPGNSPVDGAIRGTESQVNVLTTIGGVAQPSRGSLDFTSRATSTVVTVQSLRETTEAALPGVFTATLKLIVEVDAEPAIESVSLDQAIMNLLSCFAKCYGKGEAKNRRGIIQFAASKVTKFRSFVTLRFSVATRALSYINMPLSLCSDPNFWADTSPNLLQLEQQSNSVRQSLCARLHFLSSLEPISSFPPMQIPADVSGSVFSSGEICNSQSCGKFLSLHINKARGVVQLVLSSVEGSDTSKLLVELEDVIHSQQIALEEIASANDTLNLQWSQNIGKTTGLTLAGSHATAIIKSVRPLLRELNKHISWVQSIPQALQTLHDSQFSRIFIEFLKEKNPNDKESYFDLYKSLHELDELISEKINPNGAVFLEAHQWCLQQVTKLWKVYISDNEQPLHNLFQNPTPELLCGVNSPSEMFWKRQKSIPVLSSNAWSSMNGDDDIGLESCGDIRPNLFVEFLRSKQSGISYLLKEIEAKLEAFAQALKQKVPSISQVGKKAALEAGAASEGVIFHEFLSKIINAGTVVKRNIKILASAEESNTHQKFSAKFSSILEDTKATTKKFVQKFLSNFSSEASNQINELFDPSAWVFKQCPLLSESFLHFLQEKGAGVTQSSADSCHMLLLDVDLDFSIAAIPNFNTFLKLRQNICDNFLSHFTVLMPESSDDFSPSSLVIDQQFNRQFVSHHFRRITSALPDFPCKYAQTCVQALDLTEEIMDKDYFNRQFDDFKDHISCSIHRLALVLKRYPVKESELKFLKILRNLPKLGRLCREKQNGYKKKIERYSSAYLDFNKELLSLTGDLKNRIESRDNGLTKPEKVLEKADDYFQTLSKLFLKVIKFGNGLRKAPSVLEFCAEFVEFSVSSSPCGVLSALLQLYRAETRFSLSLLPNLSAVEPFILTIKDAGYVLKVGSEWFYPSHTRSLQLSGWSEASAAELPYLASPFFHEVAPYKCNSSQDSTMVSKTLIYLVAETAKRFSQDLKKYGLTNLDILSNKLRQSVACIGQNLLDFSTANVTLEAACSDVYANSSKEYTAAIVSQILEGKDSIKKYVTETHDALVSVNQALSSLQELQFTRCLLRIIKDPSKSFWKATSADVMSPFWQLRDLFNALHAFDIKVSEIFNPHGSHYLETMEWLSHKLRLLEDWTIMLSQDQIDIINNLHSSENSSLQFWMREFAIQTIQAEAYEDPLWTPSHQQLYSKLSSPRTSNEAFDALMSDKKKLLTEFLSSAESCVKDAVEFLEAQFANYVSLKSAKSKDVPKSGPSFDEFSAVDEVIIAMTSNLKKFKTASETVLDACSKFASCLQSFEKKVEANVQRTQEQLASIVSRWEGKFNDTFKKYCKSVESASVHNGRFQLSQIFVDWWRLAGRSDVLHMASSFIRILRCFDNEVISFFRPATKPLLEVRRHLITLHCRLDCNSSAIEESVLDMSETLPVDKFIWPTHVTTRPFALVTLDHSQVMESRFSNVRVAALLQELRLRMSNIKSALENARVFYKDIKEEKSQAFGFSKIKNALPSFESYLEEELAEYVKSYSLLDERAKHLLSTKPALSAVHKNPAMLQNYQNGVAKWQRDASNLSVTGGGFIRKLPIRNCIQSLQQKLRSSTFKQLVSFHEMRKNLIGLEITSAAWNFRRAVEKVTAMQLFEQFRASYSLQLPASNDSAQDIYAMIKQAAISRIASATLPVRKQLLDLMVGIIPSAVIVAEEYNNRKFLQEAIFEKFNKNLSEENFSAVMSICEPWDQFVQGFCTFYSFADAIKQCTSFDVTVLIDGNDDADDDRRKVDSGVEVIHVTLCIGDLSYDFPAVKAKVRSESHGETSFPFALVAGNAAKAANILSNGYFSPNALQFALNRVQAETNMLKQDIANIPGMDSSKVPEILAIVNQINAEAHTAIRTFSEKIRNLMSGAGSLLMAVKQEMATKLDDIRVIAQKDQVWHIHSSQFSMLQNSICEANASLLRDLQYDYEPLQALTEIYNDQFMCTPQYQIEMNFGESKDIVSFIHGVASSAWFNSSDTSDAKEDLSYFFIHQLKLKYDDVQNSVKRLEVVCRRVKDTANDFAQSPTKKKILSKLRARVFKSVLVENSLKLSFAPFGYSFCKLMTEKRAWERAEIDSVFRTDLRDLIHRIIKLDFQLTFLIRADFSNPLKIITQSPKTVGSPLTADAISLVSFSIDPPNVPFLEDVDAVIQGKGDLNKFYGGRYGGKQPLSVFSIKTSLYDYLVSWHAFFRPGKVPSKEYLEFKAPVTIKKMLTSSQKMLSFKVDAQDIYLLLQDADGKSEQTMHLNTIIVCRAAPQASVPNKLVMLEHNNDTVFSFATSEAASEALNAILECQLLALSSSKENPSSPRWQSEYAIKSFLLQFEYDYVFTSLAARKLLERYYPGVSTFVDISDYAPRIQLEMHNSAVSVVESSQVARKLPKAEKVPGGCLEFAISLTPEAHPLAEDRVATIALLGALDLPRPESAKAKLTGMIQDVYYVIERGYSRTMSQPVVDCEGSPKFVEKLSVETFHAAEAAMVEFDQENSMISIKLHRKEPPKPKPKSSSQETVKKDEDDDAEAEEEDDANDELIAYCEFNLWDLVDIERGFQHVNLLEKIRETFDSLTPSNAVRVLSNECHPSMHNPIGREMIERRKHKDSSEEDASGNKKNGLMSSLMSSVKGAIQDKAKEAMSSVKEALQEKAKELVSNAKADLLVAPPNDGVVVAASTSADLDQQEVVQMQVRMFAAKKQLKRSLQSLRQIAIGQSQETCGNVMKIDFLKQARGTNCQYFQFWLQSSPSKPLGEKQLLHSHYSEEDVKKVCHEATAQYMMVLKGCHDIFDSEMMLSLRPVMLKSLFTVKDKASEFGELSHSSYEQIAEKHEELEKLCGEFDLNPLSFNSLSSLFGFWWRGAAPRFSHVAVITKEQANLQLLRYQQRARMKNPAKVAELEEKINKSADRLSLLKSQSPDKCKEFCAVMLSVFGDAYAFDCALADAIHLDSRRAFELNDALKSLNSDFRVFIPTRPSPPSLSYEAFVNCFGGLETVSVGLEARSIAIISRPLAAVSAHVVASITRFDSKCSVSRHLLRIADQISNSDWADWLACTTNSSAIINKTSEAYMMNYAHMSGNLRAKAYSSFLQWSDVNKRLLPGKSYIEPPEFARMRPGDSYEDDSETGPVSMWNSKMVQALQEIMFLMRALDNPATFNRPFIDVCVTVYQHMHFFRRFLQNSSVIFEGILTNLDFWIACIGSQDAQDMVFAIKSHKVLLKECINAACSGDPSSAISSVSRLISQLQPQPSKMKKDIWMCATLALILEQSLRSGDLVGAISCCTSMLPIALSYGDSIEKVSSKVISTLEISDDDRKSHIPAIIGALLEVASFLNSKVASMAVVPAETAGEICELVAEMCDRIFAPVFQEVQGSNDLEKQIEFCSFKLRQVASSSISPTPAVAETWATSNRSKIFEAIVAPIPELKSYIWTCEAFTQAGIALKLLHLLCSSESSVISSVLWMLAQFFASASPAHLASTCPELNKIFMRCCCGGRQFNFGAVGSGVIPIPEKISSLAICCQKLCQAFSPESNQHERAIGISDFIGSIASDPGSLTIASSFMHLRSVRKSLLGSFGSIYKFFHCVGHANIVRLSLLIELKRYADATYLLKHLQRICLNFKEQDDADVASIVDFCIVGLVSQACKALPTISSPSGASLFFTACSCSSINRSVSALDFSKILYSAIAAPHVSENEIELAVFTLISVSQCFGKSFSVELETHSASVSKFLSMGQSLISHSGVAQDVAPRFQQLSSLVLPELIANPKLLGSTSMIEANNLLKSQVQLMSLEFSKSSFDWKAIRLTVLNLLDTILKAQATIAAHCVLALGAALSFSLRLKQLLRESVDDSASVQLLVANLFTIGCSGDGDPGDILHSIASAVVARNGVDIMDALSARTRADLAEDPNAMEFFNKFSSKENIYKCIDLQRQIEEGYEPGGHRMTALKGSLATAGELMAISFSNSFFSHTGRPAIVLMCCKAFSVWGLNDDQVKILAGLGPHLSTLFSAVASRNYKQVHDICDESIKLMTRYRLKEPLSMNRDYFWIICSLLLAIKVISFCALSVQREGPVSERLLYCIPMLQRIGFPSEALMETLCQKFFLSPIEERAFVTAVTGAWHLLRASSSMKDQSILGAAKSFGLFFQFMKDDSNCFEKVGVQRNALLKMFSPGLNRKIAQGLLNNLNCCSAVCDALDKDSTTALIDSTTLGSKSPTPRRSLVGAATELLESDSELREAKRILTSDFSSNWMVKKAVAVKFKVTRETVSSLVLDRVKESFESCNADDDEASSDEQKGMMNQVADALTPAAIKAMVPAVMTVVTICSKDIPAILRRLTIEYFTNRESEFLKRRNEDLCKEAGIPFNPAQLAEPGAYLDLIKTILNPIQFKYLAIVLDKAEKEVFPLVKDIINSLPVQAVLKVPPLSSLSSGTYINIIMTAIKSAFAVWVASRCRTINEMEVHQSHLLLYAKLVPMKERLQNVAKNYFGDLTVVMKRSFFVHSAVFAACAKAVFFSVQMSATQSGDALAEWKQLKEQLCNCGDANVAAFLSNHRRSKAVMSLSLANIALLRKLRVSVAPKSLFSFAEHLNRHSAAVNCKLDSEFEDWDFFANDYDNRLECLFQQGQSSGLKAFIAACMREAAVMVLTNLDVSETSPSLLAAIPDQTGSMT